MLSHFIDSSMSYTKRNKEGQTDCTIRKTKQNNGIHILKGEEELKNTGNKGKTYESGVIE